MASLIYKDRHEVKSSGIELKSSIAEYSAEETLARYDDDGNEIGEYDSDLKQEIDLDGLKGIKQIGNKTLRLRFIDGDIFRITVNPSKMDEVIRLLKSKSFRRSNRKYICY